MSKYFDIISGIKDKVFKVLDSETGETADPIPTAKDDVQVASFVTTCWDESKKYFENQFGKSKDNRFIEFSTPQEFWQACLKLESGNHWEVYGHRNDGSDDNWKQEVVDPTIGDQIRARSAYLSANFHDVSIQPNIKGLNEILDQERKATGWGKKVRRVVKYMGVFGEVWEKSLLDKSIDARGVANEVVCRPGSVLMNPHAWGKEKSEGCWYACHAQMVNEYYIREAFPEFDISSIATVKSTYEKFFTFNQNDLDSDFNHTHQYDLIEQYLDDDTLEPVPFDEDEFNRRAAVVAQMATQPNQPEPQIEPAVPDVDDNHKKYMKAWQDWLEERVNLAESEKAKGQFSDEDGQILEAMAEGVDEQVKQHAELAAKAPKWSKGGSKKRKYPNGRLIITIGGKVAQDDENPYEFDWRNLFHKIVNEEVPERLDGRGDTEILYPTNKAMDQSLSRYADGLIQGAHPKPWLQENDRAQIKKDGWSNNPLQPAYYTQSPPVFPKPAPATEELVLYDRLKQNSQNRLGITDVTFGQSPDKKASGEKIQALIGQNEILVTGEANACLSDAIEEIIETRILIMKQFYTEPRMYYISGKKKYLILSDLLSFEEVNENGQMQKRKISKFEISVRPESNFPNKWGKDLSMLLQMYQLKREDGQTPLIPSQAIIDFVSQRYAQFGSDSEYNQVMEATKIGLQQIQQQQAQKQAETQDLTKAANAFKAKALHSIVNAKGAPIPQVQPEAAPAPSNGAAQ